MNKHDLVPYIKAEVALTKDEDSKQTSTEKVLVPDEQPKEFWDFILRFSKSRPRKKSW